MVQPHAHSLINLRRDRQVKVAVGILLQSHHLLPIQTAPAAVDNWSMRLSRQRLADLRWKVTTDIEYTMVMLLSSSMRGVNASGSLGGTEGIAHVRRNDICEVAHMIEKMIFMVSCSENAQNMPLSGEELYGNREMMYQRFRRCAILFATKIARSIPKFENFLPILLMQKGEMSYQIDTRNMEVDQLNIMRDLGIPIRRRRMFGAGAA